MEDNIPSKWSDAPKSKWSEATLEQKIVEAKALSEPLFDTEKTAIKNYRVSNLIRLQKLSQIIDLPQKEEHIRIVTHNAFNAFSWIDYLCSKFTFFEQVYVTSYNFSESPISILLEKFDQKVFQKLSIVISESIRFRMPKRFQQLKSGIENRNNPNLRCAAVWNHTKIILMKPSGTDDHFIIEGSGNFSENAYIEQYSFDNSEQIFNFHKNWIDNYVFDNVSKSRHLIL